MAFTVSFSSMCYSQLHLVISHLYYHFLSLVLSPFRSSMKGHSWFSIDSSFVTAPETLIRPNLKHEKQQGCFCFQFFCSLGCVETIILIIQKRPSMYIEDAVITRSLAALCSSSVDLHLINSASHWELILWRIIYL